MHTSGEQYLQYFKNRYKIYKKTEGNPLGFWTKEATYELNSGKIKTYQKILS